MRETSKKMTATERARPFARFAFEAMFLVDYFEHEDYVSSIFDFDDEIMRSNFAAEIVNAAQPHIDKMAFAHNIPVAEFKQKIFDDLFDSNLSDDTLIALALAAKARRS
jgi:hypothetical protein